MPHKVNDGNGYIQGFGHGRLSAKMAWFFVLGIAVFAIFGLVQFFHYRGSSDWPAVEGVIEGAPELHAFGGRGTSYYAILFYSYAVDGDRYSGEWTSPSKPTQKMIVDVIAAKLPSGTKIAIRYNPKKPEVSTPDISPALFDENAMIKLDL